MMISTAPNWWDGGGGGGAWGVGGGGGGRNKIICWNAGSTL